MNRLLTLLTGIALVASCCNDKSTNDMDLTQEWDKTFPKSDRAEPLTTHKILSPDNSNEWLEPVTDEQYKLIHSK